MPKLAEVPTLFVDDRLRGLCDTVPNNNSMFRNGTVAVRTEG